MRVNIDEIERKKEKVTDFLFILYEITLMTQPDSQSPRLLFVGYRVSSPVGEEFWALSWQVIELYFWALSILLPLYVFTGCNLHFFLQDFDNFGFGILNRDYGYNILKT